MITKSRLTLLTAVALFAACGPGARGAEPVLKFKGSASHVAVGSPAALQVANNSPLTVEGWMRFTTLKAGDFLYSKRTVRTASAVYSCMFGVRTSGTLLSAYTGFGSSPANQWRDVTLPAALQAGRWYHLAFSHDGTNLVYYLDGGPVGTNAFSFGNNTAHPITIGGYTDTTDVNGNVCDLRVWNHARSAAQILGSMNRRLVGNETGLLGYWPMNEGDGLQTFDATTAASTGTVVNADWQWDNTLDLLATGGYLVALPFALADPDTGSARFTNSNRVDIADCPIPAGYDQIQFTESGDTGALGAWLPVSDLPADYTFTFQPVADTNLALFAWFTNSTESVALRRAEGQIFFTTVKPVPRVKGVLARSLREGETTVAITYSDINDGTTGGVADGMALTFNQALFCADDLTPTQPYVTLSETGTFDVVLQVTNEAGNTASATTTVSVVSRENEIFVSNDGDHSTGKSWATAFTNFVSAVNAASSNDTIYLAGQTFALVEQAVLSRSNVRILGGFAATNAAGPGEFDAARWPTVITPAPGVSKRFLRIQNVGTVELARITFKNAFNPDAWEDRYGGAIRGDGVSGLLLRDCRLYGNGLQGNSGARAYGGGMALFNSTGIISNCVFSANYSMGGGTPGGSGGALYLEGGGLLIRDSVIQGNWAQPAVHASWGGAFYVKSGTHTLHNVLLNKNRARRGGSGSATAYGSALYIESAATVAIRNSTLYGHINCAIYNASPNVTIANSIFAGNTPDFGGTEPDLSHTLTGDGIQAGVKGNRSGDPLFDEEGFYLLPASPCINAGTGTVAEAGLAGYTTQTSGEPDTGVVDMGYHHASGALPFDVFHVAESGNDGADGAGWETALRSIRRALELGGNRVRVHLGAGVYTSATESFPMALRDDRTLQLLGTNAALTRLDAGGGNTTLLDVLDAWGPNRLQGVTLAGASGAQGRGIQVTRGTLYLDGCVVSNNQLSMTHAQGAALRAELAEVNATRCIFVKNTATAGWDGTGRGGGVYLAEVTGGFTGCTIQSNVLINGQGYAAYGGGLYMIRSLFELHDCRIVGNQVRWRPRAGKTPSCWGGGLYAEGWSGDGEKGRVSLRNVLLADNRLLQDSDGQPTPPSYLNAAGIWADNNAGMMIENATIAANIGGGGVRGSDGAQQFVNTILWGNLPNDFTNLTAAAFAHSRADNLIAGARGNIAADPRLIDPAGGDYGLKTVFGQYTADGGIVRHDATSPCIDAGTNGVWMAGATDLRGLPRIARGLPAGSRTADMGAFEVGTPPNGSMLLIR